MQEKKFEAVASGEQHPQYAVHIHRESELYARPNDIRSPYARDFTRILHCLAYRRLKHKTQVFFNIDNDHICTRMEHVQHVESVSCTIAKFLGLNTDLTRAVARGHDLGHAPFGHEGENELSAIRARYGLDKFWHERNSLRMIDSIELLRDAEGRYQNLDLTYAVRDGIIAHCGEVDENGLMPRTEAIDLADFSRPGQYDPFTWEGCVVKISDKIAYLGRDIEDALRLDFLSADDLAELRQIGDRHHEPEINTTVLIHNFITDICATSTPETGIRLSDPYHALLTEIKHFNYRHIYMNQKFKVYKDYVSLILKSIFDLLISAYDGERTPERLRALRRSYPMLAGDMERHLYHYSDLLPTDSTADEIRTHWHNRKIYGRLATERDYAVAILDYIAGMTDAYAIRAFNELLTYRSGGE